MTQGDLNLLDRIRGLVIDLDGVLYIDGYAIDGVDRFDVFIREYDIRAIYVTNNSTLPVEEVGERLSSIGIQVGVDNIITSATATARYLRRTFANGSPVMVVGEAGLYRAVQDADMVVSEERPEVVVTGLDRDITYEKIQKASRAIERGAAFVACNVDSSYPSRDGISPGAGVIAAAIQTTTGKDPLVLGKPEPAMFLEAAERMALAPGECAVIGDRLDVDILTAERAGMMGILVLSGLASLDMVPDANPQPDLIFNDVGELADVWRTRLENGA